MSSTPPQGIVRREEFLPTRFTKSTVVLQTREIRDRKSATALGPNLRISTQKTSSRVYLPPLGPEGAREEHRQWSVEEVKRVGQRHVE